MGGDPVAERLAWALREAHRHRMHFGGGEQALRQLGRQVGQDAQLADDQAGAFGVARPHRVMLALLDDVALAGHPLDDAVDRGLLVRIDMLDVGRVAQSIHGSPLSRSGAGLPRLQVFKEA